MFILRESVTYRYRTLHVHSSANSTLPHSPNLGNLRRSSNANRVHRIGELDLKSFTDLKSFPTGYVSRLPPVSFTGRYVVWPRDGGGNHRAAPSDVVSTTITMRTTHVGRARARPLAAALILDRARGCAEGARGGADGPRGGAQRVLEAAVRSSTRPGAERATLPRGEGGGRQDDDHGCQMIHSLGMGFRSTCSGAQCALTDRPSV